MTAPSPAEPVHGSPRRANRTARARLLRLLERFLTDRGPARWS